MHSWLQKSRVLLLALMIAATRSDMVGILWAQTVIPTRQLAFTIPFTVTTPRVAQEAAQEVRLLMSEDRGASWQVADRVKPDAGEFHFRATSDGEYWYRVQTVNQSGQITPESNVGQPLRVLVDTEQPKLSVTASRTPQGQVEIGLRAEDTNIDPTTLVLEFQPGQRETWQPLAIDTSQLEQFSGGIQGSQKLVLNGQEPIQVRATIRDRAGNQAITHATVQQPDSTRYVDPQAVGRALEIPKQSENNIGPRHPHDRRQNQGQQDNGSPTGPSQIVPNQDRVTERTPLSGAAAKPPISRNVQPGNSSVVTARTGIEPRYVKSKSFQLDYNVGPTAADGVVRIDLWGTIDGGVSWNYYGTDLDRQSPFPVTVSSKGLYGFRVVVYRGDGTRDTLPKVGDDAHVWISVHDAGGPTRR